MKFINIPLHKVQITISLCLLLQLFLSSQLWWPTSRSFPLVPAFDALPISFTNEMALWPASIFALLLILNIFIKGNKWLLLVTVFAGGILILEDVNRLQIWFYQLLVMLFLLAFQKRLGKRIVKSNLQFILIAIYIWSGFNKLGVYYYEDTFLWFMEAFPPLKSLGEFRFLAIASALIEMGLGIGLIFKKTRRLTCCFAIAFHCFILLVLGPLGHNWNQVVWPWNVAQMLLVFFLFHQTSEVSLKQLFQVRLLSIPIVLLFGIMPAFNIIDKWPDQLSFKMYSGAYSEGVIFAPAKDGTCFPNHKDVYVGQSPQETAEYSLILDDWALSELGVTPFVNQRFYHRLGKRYCDCLKDTTFAGIEILTVDRWNRKNEGYKRLPCGLLKAEK